ncbi:PIN domain-containing protein [Azospirillum sp. SYSU D00513]|uniref:PIN domain-containing protein n=1 Tax=Azospirillum sp. SYSU D00513 TaxID=2812561 RepID=UPI001A9646C2|nr:PIN domain-containing protein [Azospirillum sp. SYSU D00513]
MSEPSQIIFIDTNCLIHLRDLKDLPWQSLFPKSKWIDIAIAPIVIEDLDKFKVDRESRRRDRSRQALAIIEEASTKADFRLFLKEGSIKLSLRVSSASRVDWSSFPSLDPTRADDQLVATALSENALSPCVLLSHDTGPLIRARMTGLAAHRPPADWHLPEQPDSTKQEIARLKREIETLRATRPSIHAAFELNGSVTTEIVFPIIQLPQIPLEIRKILSTEWISRHPKIFLSSPDPHLRLGTMYFEDGYSKYDIDKYQKDYDDFERATESYFENMHKILKKTSMIMEVQYAIENTSSVTATNLTIKYTGPDDTILFGDKEEVPHWTDSLDMPLPPEQPKTRQQSRYESFAQFHTPIINQMKPRDPTKFYWQDRPKASTRSGSLICAEFRAMRTWRDSFFLIPEKKPFSGPVTLTLSATNLPAPYEAKANIKLQEKLMNWTDAEVLSRIDPWIHEHLKAI